MSGSLRDRWAGRRQSTNVIDARSSGTDIRITFDWFYDNFQTIAGQQVVLIFSDGSVDDFWSGTYSGSINVYLEATNMPKFSEASPAITTGQKRTIENMIRSAKSLNNRVILNPPHDPDAVTIVQYAQSLLNQK